MNILAWGWPSWLHGPGAEWWSGVWGHTEYGVAWVITVVLLIVGLVGTVLPVLPDSSDQRNGYGG